MKRISARTDRMIKMLFERPPDERRDNITAQHAQNGEKKQISHKNFMTESIRLLLKYLKAKLTDILLTGDIAALSAR